MPEPNGTNRLDRIERALELLVDDHVHFREEHKQLLTTQVVLTDRLDRFIDSSAKAHRLIEEKFAELTDKLNGLIGYVDGLRPPAG